MSDVLGLGKAVEKLIDPIADLVKRIAGPAADEVGLTVQDSVRVYRAKRQYRLLEKMEQFCKSRGIQPQPIPLKLLLPAIDAAGAECDEDLHTMWANLLTNAADPRHRGVLPSFAQVLRQISKGEALFLQHFYGHVLARWKVHQKQEQIVVGVGELIKIYQNAVPDTFDTDEFALTLDDLQRLGLLRVKTDTYIGSETVNSLYDGVAPADMHHAYYLTDYAIRFMGACQPPAADSVE
jgi:hypothetical protein